MASKCSSDRKNHMSLTLTHKLEMIRLNNEGMSKAETGWKQGFLGQAISQVLKAKEKLLKEIKSATTDDKIENSLVDMEKVLLV